MADAKSSKLFKTPMDLARAYGQKGRGITTRNEAQRVLALEVAQVSPTVKKKGAAVLSLIIHILLKANRKICIMKRTVRRCRKKNYKHLIRPMGCYTWIRFARGTQEHYL